MYVSTIKAPLENVVCINEPRHEVQGLMNYKGADQTVQMCSLISTFVIHLLESIKSKFALSEI